MLCRQIEFMPLLCVLQYLFKKIILHQTWAKGGRLSNEWAAANVSGYQHKKAV